SSGGRVMRICASCGETYPEKVERCDLCGTALSTWEEATRVVLGPADDASAGHRVAPDLDDETIERPTVRRLTGPLPAQVGPEAIAGHAVAPFAMARPGSAGPGATVVARPLARRDPARARILD